MARWIGVVAAAGVLVTHWLAYLLAAPDGADRHDLLHHTGHDGWTVAMALALGALATIAVRRPTPARLVAVQALGWIALETAERVAFADHASSLWDNPVVLLGLAVQVGIALVAAVVLSVGRRVLARLARTPRPARRPRTNSFPRLGRLQPAPCAAPLSGGVGLRGPPRD